MSNGLIGLLALLTVFAVVFFVMYILPALEKKKNKKMYDSIQVGDKYIKRCTDQNPFKKQWGGVIIITDKAMNENGILYVKYLDGYLERTGKLLYLIEDLDYVPYNNQDKKQ